jgi:hypothetical protein
MTPLAARLRDLRDRCRTKKQKEVALLLLSYRECEAVLDLLAGAKGALNFCDDTATDDTVVDFPRLRTAVNALESP